MNSSHFLVKKKTWRACVACSNLNLTCSSFYHYEATLFLETLVPLCATKAESPGKLSLQCVAASLFNSLSCPQ